MRNHLDCIFVVDVENEVIWEPSDAMKPQIGKLRMNGVESASDFWRLGQFHQRRFCAVQESHRRTETCCSDVLRYAFGILCSLQSPQDSDGHPQPSEWRAINRCFMSTHS